MLKRFSFLIMATLMVLFLLCSGSLYALDTKGLVLYLPFDEGSGKVVKDASGNGNDGELKGDCEWVEGKFGKAVHLKAAEDLVEVPHSDSLNIKQDITMEIWTKVDSMGVELFSSFITKCTGDKIGAYMLHVDGSAGKVKIDPLVFIGNDYGTWPTPVNVTIPFGEWHHVAASYDGTGYEIYIDGELEGEYERVKGGELDQSDAAVAIGRDNRFVIPGTRFMDCIVDEARIWNRVLSENEIKEAMKGVLLSVAPKDAITATWSEIKIGS